MKKTSEFEQTANTKIKENLRKYYNEESQLRDNSEKSDWKLAVRQDFCDLIRKKNKKTLLEIGAGAGYDSLYFMDCGMKVVAIDLSKEMVKRCIEKGIEAYELDFYNLSSLSSFGCQAEKFDCVWAMNTLLHVPKVDLPTVLSEIKGILAKNGLFYMGVYGGVDSENEYLLEEISDAPRFFSYYSRENLESLLAEHFRIISFEQFEIMRKGETHIFQSVVLENLE